MPTNIKQIEFLARAIVNRLEDRGLVEFGDAEIGIQIVTRTLEDNFQAYDSIELEARGRLARSIGEREPTDNELAEEMQRVAMERHGRGVKNRLAGNKFFWLADVRKDLLQRLQGASGQSGQCHGRAGQLEKATA